MTRRMTIVFDDDDLYTRLKVEAARSHRPAKDLVAEALRLLFDASRPGTHVESDAGGGERPDAHAVEEILRELGLARERAGSQP